MKNFIVAISIFVAVGSLAFLYKNYQETSNARESLNKERYARMVAEETIQKKESEISDLSGQLDTAHKKIEKIQSILDLEQSAKKELGAKVDQLSKANEQLISQIEAQLEQINQQAQAIIPTAIATEVELNSAQ